LNSTGAGAQFQDGQLVGIDGLMIDKTIAMMQSTKGGGDHRVSPGVFSPGATYHNQPKPAAEPGQGQSKKRQARGDSQINIKKAIIKTAYDNMEGQFSQQFRHQGINAMTNSQIIFSKAKRQDE